MRLLTNLDLATLVATACLRVRRLILVVWSAVSWHCTACGRHSPRWSAQTSTCWTRSGTGRHLFLQVRATGRALLTWQLKRSAVENNFD